MNFGKALGILVLASMTLTACSDVNPTVSTLRGNTSTTSPGSATDPVSAHGSYIKIDQPASGVLTTTAGLKMSMNVSKGDSVPATSSSGQYKLYLDDSDQ